MPDRLRTSTDRWPLSRVRTAYRVITRAAAAGRLAIVDRGWFGCTPLERHVVICGFPRSGSTLLALMIQCCVDEAYCYDGEVAALIAARTAGRNHRFLVSKRPKDIFELDAIREHYQHRPARAVFVITLRDPRAVLTSRHAVRPGYYVSVKRWRSIWERLRTLDTSAGDTLVVRSETLVQQCRDVQESLRGLVGWTSRYDFQDFWNHVPASFTAVSLNGVRPLDPGTIDKWREPQHAERIRSLLDKEFPELCDRLVELGYENDDRWAERYRTQE